MQLPVNEKLLPIVWHHYQDAININLERSIRDKIVQISYAFYHHNMALTFQFYSNKSEWTRVSITAMILIQSTNLVKYHRNVQRVRELGFGQPQHLAELQSVWQHLFLKNSGCVKHIVSCLHQNEL